MLHLVHFYDGDLNTYVLLILLGADKFILQQHMWACVPPYVVDAKCMWQYLVIKNALGVGNSPPPPPPPRKNR